MGAAAAQLPNWSTSRPVDWLTGSRPWDCPQPVAELTLDSKCEALKDAKGIQPKEQAKVLRNKEITLN